MTAHRAPRTPDTDALAAAASALHNGDLVGFPTETVYGLGADARDPAAVARVFAAKGRPSDHPLICHVASANDARPLVATMNPAAEALATAFWPGPLTLVMARSAAVPDAVTGGRDTVAVRVPAHAVALALLRAFGGPIAAPSANRFGRPSPTCADDVVDELGDAVAMVLDGGPCDIGIESTVVDMTTDPPQVLRPGRISAAQLSQVIGAPVSAEASGPARAPGMLESHYAPGAHVRVVDAPDAAQVATELAGDGPVAIMAPDQVPGLPADALVLGPMGAADDYAARLYAAFRRADAHAARWIVAVPPPAEGIGVAVRDRLARASAGR
ncbi:MAG: L-threonylcarbamoyladenylate synthase [Miltoncostaeaceae bacterium]